MPANAEHNNKFYYGFWNNKNLVAVLELILFYPDGQTAMIGFFMVHNDFQGSGVGSKIIQSLLQYLRELHFEYAVLSYVSGNEQSHSFWLKNGFCDTEDEDIFEDISLRVMELRLWSTFWTCRILADTGVMVCPIAALLSATRYIVAALFILFMSGVTSWDSEFFAAGLEY